MNRAGPILVVDDDESILAVVKMVLEDEGHSVLLARDGSEALALLESTRPRLILLDLRMPNVNGSQFAKAYRKGPGPHASIVVLTAGRDAPEAAAAAGASDYLRKPFDVEDLVRIVSSLVPDGSS